MKKSNSLRSFAVPVVAASAALVLVAGCGGSGGASGAESGQGGVRVVASTTQIGDFVRNVGGERVEEHQILQPNSDPHDYEPRPEDVRSTATADVAFVNGQDLDPWMETVVSESGSEANVVDLSENLPDRVESSGEEYSDEEHSEEGSAHEGEYEPHWWHDPANAEAAVGEIRDALIAADPENEQYYTDNAESYIAKIQALDEEIAACLSAVPEERRKLVSDHDAFGYLTERYDIEFVGAVIPSQSTQGQASAGETADLISQINDENVQAVFPESSVSANLARTIAQETDATSEYTLYGDTLGPQGSDGDTYLKMMSANADSLVRGFTGGEQSCDTAGS